MSRLQEITDNLTRSEKKVSMVTLPEEDYDYIQEYIYKLEYEENLIIDGLREEVMRLNSILDTVEELEDIGDIRGYILSERKGN